MGTALCALVKSWTDKSVEERDLSACSKPSEELSTCASLLTLTNMHTSSIAVASPVQSKPALATACLTLLGCSVSCSLQPDGLTSIPAYQANQLWSTSLLRTLAFVVSEGDGPAACHDSFTLPCAGAGYSLCQATTAQ